MARFPAQRTKRSEQLLCRIMTWQCIAYNTRKINDANTTQKREKIQKMKLVPRLRIDAFHYIFMSLD